MIADGERVCAYPAREFVAFADGEGDGSGAHERVGVLASGLDAERLGRGVVNGGISGGGAVNHSKLVYGRLVDGGGGARADGQQI